MRRSGTINLPQFNKFATTEGNSKTPSSSLLICQELTMADTELRLRKAIIDKCLLSARAREAARAARDLIQRKNVLDSTLPGKLADCSERRADRCELYLVEGEIVRHCPAAVNVPD